MIPKISVIIAARNEEKSIEECLRKIPKYDNLEVIVVDDASNDKTYEIIKNFKADYDLKIFRNETPKGNAYSWDYGVKKSSGELIFLLAADAELNSFYDAIKHFDDEKVVQVLQKLYVSTKQGFLPKIFSLHEKAANYIPGVKKGLRKEYEREVNPAPDSHALMRKSFYLEVSPPVDKAAGEEYRFTWLAKNIIEKKDYKIVYEPKFIENRQKSASMKRFLIQQRWYGRNCLVHFDFRKKQGYARFMRFLLILSIICLFINLTLAVLMFSLLIFRLFVGIFGLSKNEVKYYPFVVLFFILGDLTYFIGFIESLIHRVIKGKWLIHK